jgi:hypothetical protein
MCRGQARLHGGHTQRDRGRGREPSSLVDTISSSSSFVTSSQKPQNAAPESPQTPHTHPARTHTHARTRVQAESCTTISSREGPLGNAGPSVTCGLHCRSVNHITPHHCATSTSSPSLSQENRLIVCGRRRRVQEGVSTAAIPERMNVPATAWNDTGLSHLIVAYTIHTTTVNLEFVSGTVPDQGQGQRSDDEMKCTLTNDQDIPQEKATPPTVTVWPCQVSNVRAGRGHSCLSI